MLASLLACAADAATSTQPVTTQPDQQRVDVLVAQLGDEDAKVRARASDELAALAEGVEGQLKAAQARVKDAQIRSALDTLLFNIQHARENGPTLVTMKRDAAPLADVLDVLAKQGGIEFGADFPTADPARPPIDVDFQRVPLWQALLDVCGRSGLAFRSIEGNRVLLDSVAKGAVATPAAAAGPFLVTVARVELNISKAVNFGGLKPLNVRTNAAAAPPCRLYLFAWSEPRLRTVRWSVDGVDAVAECVTDTGESLRAIAGMRVAGASGRVNSRSETQLILTAPEKPSTKIARLKLNARFIVQGALEHLELDNPLAITNHAADVAGMSVLIKSVNKVTDDQYSYEVLIRRGTRNPAEWPLLSGLLMQYPCKLLDAEGNALSPRGGSSSSAPNEVTQTMTVSRAGLAAGPKVGEPVKLVWELPSDLEQRVVPLEFRDIPLP
ncbi:MAG: hypothetical protein M3478_04535 [Planctomycetota bacterium]|nr:hypothetical protein [Planctomycetota bacterium]